MATELIMSYAAAEHAVAQQAQRRYRGKDVDAIFADVKERWQKISHLGRRMFNATADLGIALEALRSASPHGTFRDRLEKLGISKSSADRCRKLATYRAALPPKPPAELYGNVWTDHAALEFGAALFDDLDDGVPEGERMAKAVTRVRSARRASGSAQLAQRVARLEAEISEALHSSEPGAHQALDLLRGAARRLDAVAEDLVKDADREREQDP